MTNWMRTCAMITLLTVMGCQQTKEVGRSAQGLFVGATESSVQRTPEQISRAIDETAADLKYFRIGSTTKSVEGADETSVVLRNSQDQKVTISYRPESEKVTHVEVSTGPFGDSELRQTVWESLKSNLGLLSTKSTSTTTQSSLK
jgi:uncharacterized protein YcfL